MLYENEDWGKFQAVFFPSPGVVNMKTLHSPVM